MKQLEQSNEEQIFERTCLRKWLLKQGNIPYINLHPTASWVFKVGLNRFILCLSPLELHLNHGNGTWHLPVFAHKVASRFQHFVLIFATRPRTNTKSLPRPVQLNCWMLPLRWGQNIAKQSVLFCASAVEFTDIRQEELGMSSKPLGSFLDDRGRPSQNLDVDLMSCTMEVTRTLWNDARQTCKSMKHDKVPTQCTKQYPLIKLQTDDMISLHQNSEYILSFVAWNTLPIKIKEIQRGFQTAWATSNVLQGGPFSSQEHFEGVGAAPSWGNGAVMSITPQACQWRR